MDLTDAIDNEFSQLASLADDRIDLAHGAFLIAKAAYPDLDESLYLDRNKKRMHVLYVIMTLMLVTPAGALKIEFIQAGEASFNLPHDLALSPDGRYLYVADNGNDRIAVLDPNTLKVIGADYKLLGTIGSGKPGKDPGQLNTPEGVAVFGKDVWISDTYNNRIVRYQITE